MWTEGKSMSEIWRTPSLEGKWKDGKGHLVLSVVPYYHRVWVDMRLHNMEREGTTHTKHGFRVSIEQAEIMLGQLAVAIDKAKEEEEKNKREND